MVFQNRIPKFVLLVAPILLMLAGLLIIVYGSEHAILEGEAHNMQLIDSFGNASVFLLVPVLFSTSIIIAQRRKILIAIVSLALLIWILITTWHVVIDGYGCMYWHQGDIMCEPFWSDVMILYAIAVIFALFFFLANIFRAFRHGGVGWWEWIGSAIFAILIPYWGLRVLLAIS